MKPCLVRDRSPRRRPRLPALLTLLSMWSLGASGQARPDTTRRESAGTVEADSGVRLPPVQVIGSILRSTGPVVGSGVPARTLTIDDAEIADWRPRLLPNALMRASGITTYDDLGSPFKPTLVSRGFTASPVVGLPQGISVFLDGVPVNEPDAGQVNFDLLPLAHLDRIELLSGTASLLGPHSLGGAVNLVTRQAPHEGQGSVAVTTGSHDARSATAAYGATTGSWSWYAGGGHASEGGWRQLTGARQTHGFLNAGRLGPQAGIRLQAFAATGWAETAGSLPLSVYRVRPDSNLSSGDFEDITQVHLALSGYRPLGTGHGTATLYFRKHDAERFNVNQVDDPDVRSFSENRSAGGNADWTVDQPLGGGALGFRAGLGGSVNRTAIRIFAERNAPGLTTNVESPIAKFDAYSLTDFTAGPVVLSGGLRYDLVRIPFRNRLNPVRDTTSTYQRLSPRGGISVRLGPSASLYASAGQSFRAAALIELACADPTEPCPLPFALGDDPPLDPVVATTVEAGGRWLAGGIELSASVYRTTVRDDIFLFPYDDASEPSGSTIDGFFANIASTRREGVEVGSRTTIGPLTLRADYAFTRATFQVDGIEIFSIREEAGGENEVERGDRLPLVPEHAASVGGTLALPAGFELGVDARYTGERRLRGDEANVEAPLEAYWLADVRLGYRLARWSVQAIVRNVLDDAHATFGTFNINQGAGDVLERFLTPGVPRSFELVVRREIGGRD